ncbi:MAG TPA: bacillithiol biosynthesis cysteine-adding enzyme BshC [Chitinophagaceae bacterium]|nr:bacillithiol biosynthesis cysteine-adding enzyme BshC [Chitinophagaceae bacterium]
MDCISTRIPYRQAGVFSKIATDYIDQGESIKPFFRYPPTINGIRQSIEARKKYPTNRKVLVETLKMQYGELLNGKTAENIDALLSKDTFTITTAHQPNIFTGPLYFIYKILHAIKLAAHLQTTLPEYRFVPVYYMGSEDADLEELNHIYIEDEKLVWQTRQTGAVGRMEVDAGLLKLIDIAEGQLAVLPAGKEIMGLVRKFFVKGVSIQLATFHLANALFAEFGLVVLIPDNAELKRLTIPVFEDDMRHQRPSSLVSKTAEKIEAAGYKVQAHPRDINLFYLEKGIRERIVKEGNVYKVQGAALEFSENELLNELKQHPERFSPNVILRGIFQEMILPNIVFIGGGGEIAYWLQYGAMFDHYGVPYPSLVLRNSFLIVEKNSQEKIAKLGFTIEDFFLPEQELLKRLVDKETKHAIKLNGSLSQVEQLYESFRKQASAVDVTLSKHVEALKEKAVYRLQELEKKMLRAEKRKFSDQQRQISAIRSKLFPGNGLQERHDNLLYYYAKWGKEFIQELYEHSLSLEQEFVIVAER